MSLREAVNEKCKDCVYDPLAAGTWREQVTVCACTDCPLWPVRPKSTRPVRDSVLRYYGIRPDDVCLQSSNDANKLG